MFRPTFTRIARAQAPALRRTYADKTVAETVGDALKKAGQAFKSDGAVGKQFDAGGNIAEAGEAVGGPFSSKGAVGKEFTDSGSVGGSVEKAATDVKQAGKEEAHNRSHATGPSVVPEGVQKAAPKGLEEALPESVHPTKKCEFTPLDGFSHILPADMSAIENAS